MTAKKYIYFLPSIIGAIFVLIMSILPSDKLPDLWMDFFIPIDKIAHFLFYFTLSFSFSYTIKKTYSLSNLSASKLLLVFLTVFLYGIFIELLQLLIFASRNGDILDVVANLIGTISGIAVYLLVNRKIKFL